MGVLKGLSLNADGKADVKLDDTAFTRDENGLIGVKQSATGGGATTEDINELWNAINDYHKPFGINLSASPTLLEVGTASNSVKVSWTYQNSDVHDIASQTLDGVAVAVGTLSSTKSVAVTAHATKTFTLVASTTKGKSLTKTVSVTVNHASYYGVVAANKSTLTAAEIKALTKKMSTSKALSATQFTQNNQKVAYAYPSYFGDLTSIKNSSGFEGLSGYEKKTVAVDGQDYYVYLSKDAATSTDKLTFA